MLIFPVRTYVMPELIALCMPMYVCGEPVEVVDLPMYSKSCRVSATATK